MVENSFDIAPCLRSGPIAETGRTVVERAEEMGESRCASLLRLWSVPQVFGRMEAIFSSNSEPVEAVNRMLASVADFFATATRSGFALLDVTGLGRLPVDTPPDVEAVTGAHYGELFKVFSSESFWSEPKKLLEARLNRNGIAIQDLDRKSVLDAGCGGGRYTVAWKLLGAQSALGIDMSAINIDDASRRVAEAAIAGVSFRQGNVLKLPVGDNSFDIVFSNGVLHHTTDWQAGLSELVRALKPGGLGWLYLIENPGGLFWDLIEILRVVTHGEDRDFARTVLRLLGIPANRVFYMLDHVMVPINVRLTSGEISDCLTQSGATRLRRLDRGADFDRVERIFQKDPHAEVKYGVGENRFVFSK